MKKAIILFTLLVSCVAFAQEKADVSIPLNDKVQNIQLAKQLAEYGYNNFSATALIQAADILSGIPVGELKVDPKSEESAGAISGDKTNGKPFTIEQLLSDANEMAAGDNNILALAKAIKVPTATRGSVSGPYSVSDHVNSHSTDVYKIKFFAGSTAEILVIGDGDTDLDLYIYDENDNVIVKDIDSTDDCYVKWTPKWTGLFYVKIKNLGSVYNNYSLYTN